MCLYAGKKLKKQMASWQCSNTSRASNTGRYYGMVLWSYGTMELWYYGTMVAMSADNDVCLFTMCLVGWRHMSVQKIFQKC